MRSFAWLFVAVSSLASSAFAAFTVSVQSQNNVACFGGSNGTATISIGGSPVAPTTISWSGSASSSTTATGLSAGSYTATVTDSTLESHSVTFTITQPTAPVSYTTVVTNVACFGGNTGAINLTPTGGTGGYTFNWVGGATTEDRTNLAAGTYTVTITDANACTGVGNITVTQPTAPVSGTTVVTNVACFGGATGAINFTPTGGTGPYTFNWLGGPTTEDRTNLAAGSYTVVATDVNGCTGTVVANVTQPAAVNGTTVVTNVACFGGNTGAINLTPSGGTGPYTFNWLGGPTTEDRTNLVAGTYNVTITDANSCTKTVGATVTQPATSVSGSTVVSNVSCFGGSNGTIDLTPTGGTPGYTYNWGDGPTTQDRINLAAGARSVVITDANGCTGTVNATVTQPASAVSGSTVVTNIACFGGTTGMINLTPTGGTPPYTFNWAGGVTTEDRTGLAAGSYPVTITDANSCTGAVSPTVSQPASALSLATTVTNLSCNGGTTGSINLTPSGGTAPYTFNWGGGVTTEDRNAIGAGTYNVTVTDANSCVATTSATLNEPSPISVAVAKTEPTCNGSSDGALDITASGGTGPYTYDWGGGVTTEDRSGLAANTYSVTVTDANSCIATKAATLTDPAAIVLSVTTTNVTCHGGSDGTAAVSVTNGVAPFSYDWTPGSPTGDGTTSVSQLVPGTYSAKVTDANGCEATKSATITQPSPLGNPVAAAKSVSTNEETAVNITLTATDLDCDTVTISVATQPTHGVLSGTAPNVTYTPNANYAGSDSFTYTASDSGGTSAPATVSITVVNVNDAPVALAQTVSVVEDTPIVITLAGTDLDGDTLTATVVNQPAHGTLSGTSPMLTYTPDADFNGTDSFTFTVSDGQVTSAAATVSLNISAANDAPVGVAQTLTTEVDTPLMITLAGSDVEMSMLSFSVGMNPAHGTLTGTPPNLTYTPNTGFVGMDSFTFTVSDGDQSSAPVTVSITVGSMTVADAGATTDAGETVDAGGTTDAGFVELQPAQGCGCNSSGSAMGLVAMALLALVGLSRRRNPGSR